MSSLKLVPDAHLLHLLDKALKAAKASSGKRADVAEAYRSPDPAVRQTALDYIEDVLPGTHAHLDDIWAFQGAKALHLWRLPYLTKKSTRKATVQLASRKEAMGQWVKIDVPNTPENARVRRFQLTDTEIQTLVYITKQRHGEWEDEPQEMPETVKVYVRINFAGGDVPLCGIYAGHGHARTALFATLDWLQGSLTPRTTSKEQQLILVPVTFNEKEIDRFAKRLKLGTPSNLHGLHAKGQVGDLSISGHKSGDMLTGLDDSVDIVQAQLATSNKDRRYPIPHKHPDGYTETTETSFHFQTAQPHLHFHRKTSRLTMDHVINELRRDLKV